MPGALLASDKWAISATSHRDRLCRLCFGENQPGDRTKGTKSAPVRQDGRGPVRRERVVVVCPPAPCAPTTPTSTASKPTGAQADSTNHRKPTSKTWRARSKPPPARPVPPGAAPEPSRTSSAHCDASTASPKTAPGSAPATTRPAASPNRSGEHPTATPSPQAIVNNSENGSLPVRTPTLHNCRRSNAHSTAVDGQGIVQS